MVDRKFCGASALDRGWAGTTVSKQTRLKITGNIRDSFIFEPSLCGVTFLARGGRGVIHQNCHLLRKPGDERRCLACSVLRPIRTMKPGVLAVLCCAMR